MEEAVFHDPRKDSEVGSVRREEGVIRQSETGMPRCKSRTGRVVGAGCARARGPSQPGAGVVAVTSAAHPHLVMPKIKTSRTKKAPDGFEEIEPVGTAYFTVV
jgi:hypothetical protein